MEFYHGTTLGSARRIIESGFRPRGGAVWFTNHWNYAKNRADHKARRKHDRPVVFQTELKPEELPIRLGPGKVHVHGGIVAINESLSVQPVQSKLASEVLRGFQTARLGKCQSYCY